MIKSFRELIELSKRKKEKTIVVAGADDNSISACILAFKKRIAKSIFIGKKKSIDEILKREGIEEGIFEIIEEEDEEKISENAVKLICEGNADILLKGGIRSDIILRAVLRSNLKGKRILSDCLIAPHPLKKGKKIIGVADGGVNVLPDLFQKKQIIENSVEVFHKLGFEKPKVALLSATEKETSSIPSTIDAVKLMEMNKKGEIQGCVVEGPYALDNALSKFSAKKKKIVGEVAGKADILIVPNIESGNILGKAIMYFCGYNLAHVILGGKAPVLIPSRVEDAKSKLYSIALGVICSD